MESTQQNKEVSESKGDTQEKSKVVGKGGSGKGQC